MKSVNLCARASVLSLALAAAFPVFAQSESVGTLREVVVTAVRNPQILKEVVADVTVLDKEAIAAMGAQTLVDLLRQVPGMQGNGAGALFVRGAEARMVGLLIDGVRVDAQHDVANTVGGGADWNMVPIAQIERIEILRGPASALYGSEGMAGVVQVFTKRGTGAVSPAAGLGVGSNGQFRTDFSVAGVQADLDFALSLGAERSDGYNTVPTVVHSPDREAYSRSDASFRLGYQINASNRLGISALRAQKSADYVGYQPDYSLGGADKSATSGLSTGVLRWDSQWSSRYETSLMVSQSMLNHQNDSSQYATNLRTVAFESRLRLQDLGLLSALVEHKDDAIESPYADAYNAAYRGGRTQNGVGVGYGGQFKAHAWQVNLRNDHDSAFGDHATGAISYAYLFASDWKASMSAGKAFRAPSLEQLYSQYGSTSLKPEQSHSAEVAVGFDTGERTVKLLMHSSTYDNLISSNMASSACSAGMFCYFNVARASVTGQTLSGMQRVGAWEFSAVLDWLEPKNEDTGKQLNLRARETQSLGVKHAFQQWHWGAQLTTVGDRFSDAANLQRLPAHTLLSLHASRQFSRTWLWLIRVDNATDAKYQHYTNFAAPGATFYTALQWNPAN